ncbi:MAG TPA: hypothetical protein VGP07_16850 [Polyangia bacterium]|jgi:hypothetical protein
MMLLASGYSLISGMLKLRDPGVVLSIVMNDAAGSEAEVQLSQKLAAVRQATVNPHRKAVRAEAVVEVLLALFGLYATAAVMARDRHGRLLALLMAAFVIVYRLGCLPVYLSLMRDYAEKGADLLALAILQNASGGSDVSSADLAQRLRSAMIGEPIVVAVVGVACALLLIGFFGGRRGRRLYGIDAPPAPGPQKVS